MRGPHVARSAKLVRELGSEPRDPMETLEDTVAYLRERWLGGHPAAQMGPSLAETLVVSAREIAAAAPRPRLRTRKRETRS